MAVDGAWRTHPFGTDPGGEVGEGAGKLVGVDLRRAEEGDLAAARSVGVGDRDEGDHRRPRWFRLELETGQRQQRVDVPGRSGQADASVLGALRFEAELELEQGTGQVLAFETFAGPFQGLAEGVEQGIDGDHRPLQLHPLVKGRWWVVGLQRARVDAARCPVGAGAGRAETAGRAVRRQSGEVAEGAHAPTAQGVHETSIEMQMGQRQGGEEEHFLAGGHHLWRVGHACGDACGELVAGDADPHRQVEGLGGDDRGLSHVVLTRVPFEETLHAADVGEDDVRSGILDPR